MPGKLKITLKRSAIGCERSQGATVRLLGFTKLQQTRIHDDNSVIRGMIHKIRHLVVVEQIPVEQTEAE